MELGYFLKTVESDLGVKLPRGIKKIIKMMGKNNGTFSLKDRVNIFLYTVEIDNTKIVDGAFEIENTRLRFNYTEKNVEVITTIKWKGTLRGKFDI